MNKVRYAVINHVQYRAKGGGVGHEPLMAHSATGSRRLPPLGLAISCPSVLETSHPSSRLCPDLPPLSSPFILLLLHHHHLDSSFSLQLPLSLCRAAGLPGFESSNCESTDRGLEQLTLEECHSGHLPSTIFFISTTMLDRHNDTLPTSRHVASQAIYLSSITAGR